MRDRKHHSYAKEIEETACGIQDLEYFREKTVAITGAGGLIGSELVDVLMYANNQWDLKCRIYAIVRNAAKAGQRFGQYLSSAYFTLFVADVNTDEIRIEKDVDFFIHAASNTHPLYYATRPIETILTNTLGTNHTLMFAAEHHCKRYIFLSSVEVYGENRGDTQAFAEDYCGYIDCNTLRAGYPEGKRAGEALCQAYIHEKKLDCVIVRIARCYGQGLLPEDTKAMTQFIKNGLAGEAIVLKSSGMQRYSYIYASDAVSAILFLMRYGKNGEAYNITGKDSDITLRELAEMIAEKTGTYVITGTAGTAEREGGSKATKAILDGSKIHRAGWQAKISLKEGMERILG